MGSLRTGGSGAFSLLASSLRQRRSAVCSPSGCPPSSPGVFPAPPPPVLLLCPHAASPSQRPALQGGERRWGGHGAHPSRHPHPLGITTNPQKGERAKRGSCPEASPKVPVPIEPAPPIPLPRGGYSTPDGQQMPASGSRAPSGTCLRASQGLRSPREGDGQAGQRRLLQGRGAAASTPGGAPRLGCQPPSPGKAKRTYCAPSSALLPVTPRDLLASPCR